MELLGSYMKKKEQFENTENSISHGVIFNCLATCAVHVDLAADYSTEKFLMIVRRKKNLDLLEQGRRGIGRQL